EVPGALDGHGNSTPLRLFCDELSRVDLGWIDAIGRADLFAQFSPRRQRLDAEDSRGARGLGQGDRGQTYRATAEHGDRTPREEPASSSEHALVGDAGRLAHCPNLEGGGLVAVALKHVVE